MTYAFHFDAGLYESAWNVTGESDAMVVFNNLAPIFWAFVGLETGAMVAGIVRDPDRNVPRATLAGRTQAWGVSAKPPNHGICAELWCSSLVGRGLFEAPRVASQGFADTP